MLKSGRSTMSWGVDEQAENALLETIKELKIQSMITGKWYKYLTKEKCGRLKYMSNSTKLKELTSSRIMQKYQTL